MRFSLYSHEYGGAVISGAIYDDCVYVTWLVDKGEVAIRKETLADTFALTEFRSDRLKYHCSMCHETINCMFNRPCCFRLSTAERLTLWGC